MEWCNKYVLFLLFTFLCPKSSCQMPVFAHSLAYSDVIASFCSCKTGKYTWLSLSSYTWRRFKSVLNNVKFESRGLTSWLGPWSLRSSSKSYLVMSTMKAKSCSHLLSLRCTTEKKLWNNLFVWFEQFCSGNKALTGSKWPAVK